MSVRIILADDDENFRTTCAEALTDAGLEVTAVANGREAVDTFAQLADEGDPPAAVILDMLMPKLAGFDAAQEIRDLDGEVQLIFISGMFKGQGSQDEAKEKFGAAGYLIKPFDNDDLAKLLNDITATAQAKLEESIERNPMPEEGRLLEAPVAYLFWRIHNELHTGILDIFGDKERGRLFFNKGKCTMGQCQDGSLNLGVQLIRHGVLDASLYQEAVTLANERRKGIHEIIKKEKFADEGQIKTAYKTLVPRVAAYFVPFMGKFRWTDTDQFLRHVPTASVSTLDAMQKGVLRATEEQLRPHVDPRGIFRIAPADNWKKIAKMLKRACGHDDVSRAINGRATVSQIVDSAATDVNRAQRLRQLFLLFSTSALRASQDVIQFDRAQYGIISEAELEAQRRDEARAAAEAQAEAAQAAGGADDSHFQTDSGPSVRFSFQVDTAGLDDGLEFSPEDQEARKKIEAQFKAMQGKTYWEVLDLDQEASEGDIKKAYLKLAREFHTDVFSGNTLGKAGPMLEAVFNALTEINTTLTDEAKKADYLARLQMTDGGQNMDIDAIFTAERAAQQGMNQLARGQLGPALQNFAVALQNDPNKAEYKAYHLYLAWMNDQQEATAPDVVKQLEVLYKTELQHMPTVLEFLGTITYQIGDKAKAGKYFKKCLREDPDNRNATRYMRMINQAAEADSKKGGLGRFMKR
jgi:CheY-like chemotaxis protein/tetratricopeptide (TPR) repeat protein